MLRRAAGRLRNNRDQVFKLFEEARELGSKSAGYYLAEYYYLDSDDLGYNPEQAKQLLEESADMGCIMAKSLLIDCYFSGREGFECNHHMAFNMAVDALVWYQTQGSNNSSLEADLFKFDFDSAVTNLATKFVYISGGYTLFSLGDGAEKTIEKLSLLNGLFRLIAFPLDNFQYSVVAGCEQDKQVVFLQALTNLSFSWLKQQHPTEILKFALIYRFLKLNDVNVSPYHLHEGEIELIQDHQNLWLTKNGEKIDRVAQQLLDYQLLKINPTTTLSLSNERLQILSKEMPSIAVLLLFKHFSSNNTCSTGLLELPLEMLIKIFSFLTGMEDTKIAGFCEKISIRYTREKVGGLQYKLPHQDITIDNGSPNESGSGSFNSSSSTSFFTSSDEEWSEEYNSDGGYSSDEEYNSPDEESGESPPPAKRQRSS